MNGGQIMKPMSVARNEFIDGMTELINNSQLPPFVIEAVLKDIYNDIRILSKQQLEIDTKNYNDALNAAAMVPEELIRGLHNA